MWFWLLGDVQQWPLNVPLVKRIKRRTECHHFSHQAHRKRYKTGLIKLANLATAELFISLASAMRNTCCDHCLRPQDSSDIYSRREDGVVSTMTRQLHGNKNLCMHIKGCLCKCIHGWLVTPTLGAAFYKTLKSFLMFY